MSSETPYIQVVEGGAAATPNVRTTGFARTLALVSVALIAGIAAVTLWCNSSSQPETVEFATQDVLFPEPTSVEHANEQLLNLPPRDPDMLYVTHVSPHIATMYKQFLLEMGSTAYGDKVHKLSSKDFGQRLPIFENNVKEIIKLNVKWHKSYVKRGTARFAISLYADWSQDEMEVLAGFKPEEGEQEATAFLAPGFSKANLSLPLGPADSIDVSDVVVAEFSAAYSYDYYYSAWPSSSIRRRTSWNWASYYPSVFQVRDQGHCGSCWAHTTAAEVRQVYAVNNGIDVGVLSAQYLVDCVYIKTCPEGVNGCCGGGVYTALGYINENGGIPLKSSYGPTHGNNPYAAHKCYQGYGKVITDRINLNGGGEAGIAKALFNYGPIAVGLQITSALMHYTGGVMTKTLCSSGKKMGGHAVTLVGYDNSLKSWIIQNSWTTRWGVERTSPYKHSETKAGFFLLHYGGKACGIGGSAYQARNPKDISRRRVSRRRAALVGHGER